MTAGKVEIAQGEIEQVYAENARGFENMGQDEAKQRIRLNLESQAKIKNYKAALSDLKSRTNIEIFLPEPLPPRADVDTNGYSLGKLNAPITIVEFSDFQCPFCKESVDTTKQVLQLYGDNVRLIFKQMPLTIHPQAFQAAQASVCAGEQGKFWLYHDRLFDDKDLSLPNLSKIAAEIGLETQKFNSCLESEASRAAVMRDMREAKRVGVNGTPTFFINGRMYSARSV